MSRSKNPAAYRDIAGATFLFSGVPGDEVETLLAIPGIAVEHFGAGEAIRSRLDPVGSLGILCYGSATVEKKGASGKILMSVLIAGDLFGAAAMFGEHETYVADITATKSAWVVTIPEEALKRMMRQDFRITENYLRYLTARIRFLSDRIDGFAEGSVEERVMHYIEKNAVDGVFCPSYPLSKLADALAVSRATLYRALDALIAEGRIAKDQKRITLLKEEQ